MPRFVTMFRYIYCNFMPDFVKYPCMMRKIVFLLFIVCSSLLSLVAAPVDAVQADSIEPDTLRISIITCDPGPDVYQIFGHTAVRVQRSGVNAVDIAFNYGLFSFQSGNFIYKFTKGETDYRLGAYDFVYFMPDYVMRGSSVVEQELNLTAEEKQQFFDRLLVNAEPQNSVYRYNFLFDNCATRPRDIALVTIGSCGEKVVFNAPDTLVTFRDIIRYYGANYSWLLFGIDLALGHDLDRPATWEEQMFIPLILSNACNDAQIVDAAGNARPLVLNRSYLYESDTVPILPPTPRYLSPMACALLLLLIGVVVTWHDVRRRTLSRWFDTTLNLLLCVMGCIIYFLVVVSEHPATTININALWLTPFAIIPVFAAYVRRLAGVVRCYHIGNIVLILLFAVLAVCRVQVINMAFIPIVLLSVLRSLNYLKYIKEKRGL